MSFAACVFSRCLVGFWGSCSSNSCPTTHCYVFNLPCLHLSSLPPQFCFVVVLVRLMWRLLHRLASCAFHVPFSAPIFVIVEHSRAVCTVDTRQKRVFCSGICVCSLISVHVCTTALPCSHATVPRIFADLLAISVVDTPTAECLVGTWQATTAQTQAACGFFSHSPGRHIRNLRCLPV